MKRSRGRIALCVCLIAGILVFIWGNSLLPAEISQKLSDWLKALLTGADHGLAAGGGSGFLRKVTHFAEFAALGCSLGWLFGMLGRGWRIPLLLGFGTACADELLQAFVPGRAPGLFDVGLDTAGVAVGLLVLYTGYAMLKKKTNNFLEETKQ